MLDKVGRVKGCIAVTSEGRVVGPSGWGLVASELAFAAGCCAALATAGAESLGSRRGETLAAA